MSTLAIAHTIPLCYPPAMPTILLAKCIAETRAGSLVDLAEGYGTWTWFAADGSANGPEFKTYSEALADIRQRWPDAKIIGLQQ